jgi:hypothetical protein
MATQRTNTFPDKSSEIVIAKGAHPPHFEVRLPNYLAMLNTRKAFASDTS